MVQVKKGQTVSLGGKRGRKSTFPAVLEYILCHYVNQNRRQLDASHLKPAHALNFCKETYQNEYRTRFTIEDDSMPPDSKIKQRFSALEQKFVKYGTLDEVFPVEPSEQ